MATKLIDRTPSAYEFPLLIKYILRSPLAYAPKQEIVYTDVKRYDYVTLYKRIGQLANVLENMGVKAGDTVAVMDWDSHRYLECFFAVPMMGAILHTVNVRLSPEQILYTINHAEDDALLVHSDFLPIVEKLRGAMKTVKTIIVLADHGPAPETSFEVAGEYEALLEKSPVDYDFPDFNENSKATTFYTTGTTGAPKGVYFSHRQLVLHTLGVGAFQARASQGGMCSKDVYMPLTPMFHVHAWGMPYLASLLGLKQVYPGRYIPETILGLIAKEGVTFSHSVPTILQMLLASPASAAVDFSGFKMTIGGSALPRGLCQAAMQRGMNIIAGYGMSETCPVLTVAHLKPHMVGWNAEEQTDIRCRTGLPVPLVDLRVVDLDGRELPHDGASVGEVVVRAPWLTMGYLKDPNGSEDLWAGGYMRTGDAGFVDPEGYLQLTDRLKDVIKSGGEWISSLLIEDTLSQHQAVSEAAVIGVPDETWGERPYAIVTIKEEHKGKVSEEDLKAFLQGFVARDVISKWSIPDRIVVVESIPKTSVGKLDKKEIRKRAKELGL
ncbi:MAG TPA: fatty acid--CoA ligase [Deltaproteobacteria bacterium]|jgi:fatty-acyl-CoA synthase|nr:fatty acid--CoA ligase [Deltaproteobacteria bacterium]